MILNPSFEGEYVQHGPETLLAEHWRPFWSNALPPMEHAQGPCSKPEYKHLTRGIDASRILTGESAQCWFVRWSVMDAGIYQQVQASPLAHYEFFCAAQAWCTAGDDPRISEREMYISLGIDPWGETDAFRLGVLWHPWMPAIETYQWYHSPIVQAKADRITVYIRAWNKYRSQHGDMYVDDANLERVGIPNDQPTGVEAVDYRRIANIVQSVVDSRRPVRYPWLEE